MKKVGIILVVLVLFIANPYSVIATSGRISKNNIISCNGTNYGSHGDGHWHKAELRGSYWYAIGSNLGYDSPCQQKPVYVPKVVEEEQPIITPATDPEEEEIKDNPIEKIDENDTDYEDIDKNVSREVNSGGDTSLNTQNNEPDENGDLLSGLITLSMLGGIGGFIFLKSKKI